MPTDAETLQKLDDPDSDFENEDWSGRSVSDAALPSSSFEETGLKGAQDEPPKRQPEMRAIPLQTPHAPRDPEPEEDEVELIEENVAHQSQAGKVFGAVSTAALVITFIVAVSLLLINLSGTTPGSIMAMLTGEEAEAPDLTEIVPKLPQTGAEQPTSESAIVPPADAGQTEEAQLPTELQNGQNAELESAALSPPAVDPVDGASDDLLNDPRADPTGEPGSEPAAAPSPPTLSGTLANRAEGGTLEPALAVLFGQWDLNYADLPGTTVCRKARARGLDCREETGGLDDNSSNGHSGGP